LFLDLILRIKLCDRWLDRESYIGQSVCKPGSSVIHSSSQSVIPPMTQPNNRWYMYEKLNQYNCLCITKPYLYLQLAAPSRL